MMKEAYEIAGAILRENIADTDRERLEAMKPENVLVVPGTYDRIGSVLDAVGVPYVEGKPTKAALKEAQVMIVNCPGDALSRRKDQVRDWVASGGRLWTTDWAVVPLQEMFPNYIRWNGKVTKDECIRLDKDSRGVDEITVSGPVPERPVWWLEGSSYPFKVSRDVEVMLTSKELKRLYGSSLVAVQWDYGQGKVKHIISHLYLQRTELRSPEDRMSFKQTSAKYGMDEMSMSRLSTTIDLDAVPDGSVAASLSAAGQLVSYMTAKSPDEVSDPSSQEPETSNGFWVN